MRERGEGGRALVLPEHRDGTTALAFDCEGGFAAWQSGWSLGEAGLVLPAPPNWQAGGSRRPGAASTWEGGRVRDREREGERERERENRERCALSSDLRCAELSVAQIRNLLIFVDRTSAQGTSETC